MVSSFLLEIIFEMSVAILMSCIHAPVSTSIVNDFPSVINLQGMAELVHTSLSLVL